MLAALLALAVYSASATASIQINGDPVPVDISQIEHFGIGSTESTFGKLEFRGGLVVASELRKFGGLSGIHVQDGGNEAIIVSDLGYVLRADLSYREGRLDKISVPQMMRIPVPSAIKHRDLEDIAVRDDGQVFVALERNRHHIAAIDRQSTKARDLVALPEGSTLLGFNSGIESIDFFPKAAPLAGHMIAIGERPDKNAKNRIPCWIIGVGTCAIKVHGEYQVTSAKFLDNGDLIILERKFTPGFNVGMRLRRIRRDDIGAGKVMDGDILIEADLAEQIDNMEGLAVHRDGEGTTILTLVSDDNLNFFQRTLILQFALLE